jgi:hypothetical protein
VPKVKEFGVTKLRKMFWPYAHGLYNLAFAVWNKDKALAIPAPESDCFRRELAAWQIERGFKPGKPFLEYPAPMELVNAILRCAPPAFTNHRPYLDDYNEFTKRYRNRFYTDEKRFEEGMVEAVLAAADGGGRKEGAP